MFCFLLCIAEAYDEGYINMAPSGATAKPYAMNGRNGNREFQSIATSVRLYDIMLCVDTTT